MDNGLTGRGARILLKAVAVHAFVIDMMQECQGLQDVISSNWFQIVITLMSCHDIPRLRCNSESKEITFFRLPKEIIQNIADTLPLDFRDV
jgi:hypothetical protein